MIARDSKVAEPRPTGVRRWRPGVSASTLSAGASPMLESLNSMSGWVSTSRSGQDARPSWTQNGTTRRPPGLQDQGPCAGAQGEDGSGSGRDDSPPFSTHARIVGEASAGCGQRFISPMFRATARKEFSRLRTPLPARFRGDSPPTWGTGVSPTLAGSNKTGRSAYEVPSLSV